MGAKIIYKKMLMQQINSCCSNIWTQHQQLVRNNLPSGQDIGYFLKIIDESLKIVVQKSAQCSNWIHHLQHVQTNYFVSHLAEEDCACQNALDIKLLVRQKYGYIFCLIAELIARLHILNAFMSKNKHDREDREKQYRYGLNSNLQKLRFQLQIENINRISEEKSVLQYQEIIQYSINNIMRQNMNLQAICLVYQVMKQENANVPDYLLENVSEIIRTGQKLKENSVVKIQKSTNQSKDRVLEFIQKKQKELQLKRKLDAQKLANLSKRSHLTSEVSHFKKEKIIQKTRTIYHQRKNVYIPRKKRQEYTTKSQKSIDMSTQWSFTIERFKKTTRDIHEDFQDDFLVGKTPKPQRVFNFKEPISFRLDFSN